MLSKLVITFLPRSKHLLISWLQSPSAVILELKKIKSVIVSLTICHEVMEKAREFKTSRVHTGIPLSSFKVAIITFSEKKVSLVRS